MVGILPTTGTGLPNHSEQRLTVEELRRSIKSRNRMLLNSIKVDKHQAWLMEDMEKDIARGRTNKPKLVKETRHQQKPPC